MNNQILAFAWNPSSDPDDDFMTYTIDIWNDPSDSNWGSDTFHYQQAGLTDNFFMFPLPKDFMDNRYYEWQVKAIDAYGKIKKCKKNFSFFVNNTGGDVGLPTQLILFDEKTRPVQNYTILCNKPLEDHVIDKNKYIAFGQANETYQFTINAHGYETQMKSITIPEFILKSETIKLNELQIDNGDINGDGIVNLYDACILMQTLTHIYTKPVFWNADINGKDKLGLEEVIYILWSISDAK